MPRGLITLILIACTLSAPSARATELPDLFKVEAGPPPIVFGCVPGPNFPAFRDCVIGHVEDLADGMQDDIHALNGQLQSKQAELTQALEQLQTPLVQALNQAQASQLNSCLASKGVSLPGTASQVISNPTAFVQSRFTELWQQGMNGAAQMIQTSMQTSSGSNPPSVSALLDQTEVVFTQLAEQDPVASCIWSLVAPFRTQAKAMVVQLVPLIQASYEQVVMDTVRPAVDQAMLRTLRPMLAQFRHSTAIVQRKASTTRRQTARAVAGTARAGAEQAGRAGAKAARRGAAAAAAMVPEEVRRIALGVAHRHLLDGKAMEEVSQGVRRLAAAVESDPAGAAQALNELERSLAKVSNFSEDIALEIGIETVRYYGHSLIDSKGRDAITLGFAGVQASKDIVVELITGIIAVFWEPAEAIGEFVAGCVEVVIDIGVQPPAEFLMIRHAHDSLDDMLGQAHRALREQKPPSYYIQNAGPLATLLHEFPTEAELVNLALPELAAMRDTLFTYHDSVRQLSRAAALGGGAARRASSNSAAPTRR